MTDVRLTALNPEDSQVYPVACNSSGELLVDKGDIGPDVDIEGNLSVGGNTTCAGIVFAKTDDNNAVKLEPWGVVKAESNNPALSVAPAFQVKFNGSQKVGLAYDGSAVFESSVNGSAFYSLEPTGTSAIAKLSWFHFYLADSAGDKTVEIKNDGSITAAGSAQFAGDVIVGSRSKQWMLVEQGGLCHMVEQTRRVTKDLVNSEYPKLRDVFQELNLIEEALSEVMEKLRLTPPAGWPVWDGSDETQ